MGSHRVSGSLFDGISAKPVPVWVEIHKDSGDITVERENGERHDINREHLSFELFDDSPLIPIAVSSIGRIEISNSPETRESLRGHLSLSGKIPAWMERHAHRAIVGMGVALVIIALFVVYAPPVVVPLIRPLVTHRIQSAIADQSFAVLDKIILAPSTLDDAKQRAVAEDALRLQERFFPERPIKVLFRQIRGRPTMMNAAALIPNNMIIIDATVTGLTPDELKAVVLHEVGHLKFNHGVDALLRSSFLGITSLMILGGDPGTLHGIAVSLLHAQYSQANEMEADRFAAESLYTLGLDPNLLASALDKIERAAEVSPSDGGKSMSDYFASHPRTSERKEALTAFKGAHSE
jgi:Zn-dependent protease with chaperone function